MSEAQGGGIIETVEFRLSPEGGQSFERDFPFLRRTLLALDGGIAARMLRERGDSGCYLMLLEWRNAEAKQRFTGDPAIATWFEALGPSILRHQDRYFDEPHPPPLG